MWYKILVLAISFSLTSCAVEVGGDDTPQDAQAGIYGGTITATGLDPAGAIVIITSDDNVAVINQLTKETFIGTRSGNSLTGTLYASTAVASTAEITSVSGNSISGTYESSLGGGTFALAITAGLYERTSELTKLSATWIDSVYTNALGLGTSTWVFNTSGTQFSVSSGSGCIGNGAFSLIDATKNEYAMTMTIENCASYDGDDYTGFAVLSDTTSTSTDDGTLTLIFSNGVFGGAAQPLK